MEANETTVVEDLKSLDEFLSNQDNSECYCYFSQVPERCKQYPCVLGIDEAGRGPVLGPMVYGTAYCCINTMTELDNLGCADSKVLNEKLREQVFSNLLKESNKVGWGMEVISPNYISNKMLSRNKYSLNKISMDSAVKLIQSAKDMGVNIRAVYVDTVGPPDKYKAYLSNLFPDFNITVESKADSTYAIVSAASIFAKVARDHSLKVWKFPEDLDIDTAMLGSGYPGDPVTKRFLHKYCDVVFGFPQIVRFSWSTAAKIIEEECYYMEMEEIENKKENSKRKSAALMSSFLTMHSGNETSSEAEDKSIIKHDFFKQRKLTRTLKL